MNLDYRALAERWMLRVDEIAAPSLMVQSGMGAQDLADLRARFEEMAIAFPDASVTLEEVMVDGPKVCLVLDWQGSQLGPLRGFPPTGRPVKFAIIMLMQMNGLLVERVRIFSEAFTGPVQMGIIPAFDDLTQNEGPA